MDKRFTKYLKSWKGVNRGVVGYICVVIIWLAMAYLGWTSHMQPVCLEKTSSFPNCRPATEHWSRYHHS